MSLPYIVYIKEYGSQDEELIHFHICKTLAEACDVKAKQGGIIYEPLGLSSARKICREGGER